MNAAAKLLDLEKELGSITAPMSPWQVYAMAIAVNRVAVNMYRLLSKNCTYHLTRIIDRYMESYQMEAEVLEERVAFHKMCVQTELEELESPVNLELFDIDLNCLVYRMNRRCEYVNHARKLKTNLKAQEIHNFCAVLRDDIGGFYQAVLALYPEGKTKQAFLEMKDLTKQTGYNINYSVHRLKYARGTVCPFISEQQDSSQEV